MYNQQYDIDDPVLLEAQQPFMEIISSAVPSRPCNSVELSGKPPPDTSVVAPYIGTESMVETNSLLPAESSCMDAVSMAFFRGMEEANKLLPSIVVPRDRDSETVVDDSSRKKRHESMASGCFLPVQLHFSNKTIYTAVAGRKMLHIVDCGLGHGIQWPDLLRWLSRREGGPPEVRLTGIDKPQPGFLPAWRVEETGRRLSACARQFGVPFEFRGVANKQPEAIHVEDLDIDPDEVLVVNSMFHLETLMDESIVVERPNPRDVVLGTIGKMRPSVFVHGIVNGSHSSAFFMARFRDALQRYTALFDMMGTIAPRDDDKRLLVEQDMFARCATSVIACEGLERVERPHNYK
ncbi:scarecrow-like protein 9 [Miscanthus floridulus]|uniref:scarecrow-like protein 9 n=1 Tax=Miscanthus floridulus TaxID=154761 RepID=UPI00345981DF